MRLYLSSYRLGDHPHEWVRLLHGGQRIAVISNALDAAPDSADYTRVSAVAEQISDLAGLGLQGDDLDLRDYFDDPSHLAETLTGYDGVWVRGGNSFVLRAAMKLSGADELLVRAIEDDQLVYAGYSAGPAVLSPSLRGIELVDPVEDVEPTYGIEPVWDGLDVLDFAFVPHYDSAPHPETEAIGRVVTRYERDGTPYRTVRDGQALLVDGRGQPRVV